MEAKWVGSRRTMMLAAFVASAVTCAGDLRVMTGRSFYTNEMTGRLIVLGAPSPGEEGSSRVRVTQADRVIVESSLDQSAAYPMVEFALEGLPLGTTELSCQLVLPDRSTASAAFELRRLPPRSGAVKIDRLTGGLIVDGLPFIPFGFYCYSPVQPTLAEEEVVRGFNLMSPYQSNAPAKRAERQLYMDRCAALGMKVHYQLLSVAGGGGVYGARDSVEQGDALRAEVRAFKDHPALLAWYISDEPTGHGAAPETLKKMRDTILAEDPYHPVTIVFMRPKKAARYAAGMDIVMVDPYPIPVRPPTSAGDAVRTVFEALAPAKAVWIVPQCFGGNEHWKREPTAAEMRVMTYLGLLEGARGIQYFIRHGLQGFPKSPLLWAECSRLALETAELTPYLLSSESRPVVETADSAIRVGAWQRDGTMVAIAINTENVPKTFRMRVPGDVAPDDVQVPFESRTVALGPSAVVPRHRGLARLMFPFRKRRAPVPPADTIVDMIDAYGVRIYRLDLGPSRSPVKALDSRNMLINSSFEANPSPGTPAGCYARAGAGRGATYFVDSRVSLDGTHALRLHTPADGEGVGISPFYPRVKPGQVFRFTVWAKAAAGPRAPELKLKMGPTTRSHTLSTEWKEYGVSGIAQKARNSKLHLYFQLSTAGTAWIDCMQCVPLSPAVCPIRHEATGEYAVDIAGIPSGGRVHYTVDGSEPTPSASVYSRPLRLERSTPLKLLLVDRDLKAPVTTTAIWRHDGNLRPLTFVQPPSPKYPGSGADALVDGLTGPNSFHNRAWQGFLREDVVATIGLKQPTPVREIRARFLQNSVSWIFLPTEVTVQASTDGLRFRTIGSVGHSVPVTRRDSLVHTFSIPGDGRPAKFVRVIGKSLGVCPAGHSGAGKDCWSFADEILVNPRPGLE